VEPPHLAAERAPGHSRPIDLHRPSELIGATVTAEQYLTAVRRRRELWGETQRFLARFDLLITPTMPVPAFAAAGLPPKQINGREISPLGWLPFTFPFNLTGQPAATVPAGFTAAGLPVGLQIVGRRHADRTVLAASAAFEAAAPWSHHRPGPDLRPPRGCG